MAWNNTGTVNVTNGSASLVGVGTNWIDQEPGWWVWIEGEAKPAEIQTIVSATELTLRAPILRATASGLDYLIIPTQGLNVVLREKIAELIMTVQNAKDGWDAVVSTFSASVYQLWLDEGNTGTVQDFLDDLVGPQGSTGSTGAAGNNGWTPQCAVVTDGVRRVLQISDWTGGAGTKPVTGQFIGATGLVATAAEAVDIRGDTGATGETGAKGDTGAIGNKGWSPVFVVASDSERRVLQVNDWVGGEGTKPAIGDYIGPAGLVSDIATAVDIRGSQGATGDTGATGNPGSTGAQGEKGWSPVLAAVNDGERRVFQVQDWTGGAGIKPATGSYVGATGLVALIGDALDVRGPAGADGTGSGTLTSIDITGGTGIESTGGPVTSSGAITVALNSATQNSLGKANTAQQPPAEGPFVNGDKTKLDGIAAGADVTNTASVTAAGALMDSEVTNLAQVKAFSSADYATAAQGTKADTAQQPPAEGPFVNGDKTKLDGIAAGADVTNTASVTVAGALMDSEVTNLAQVKAFNSADYATAAQGTTADAALPRSGGTMTGNLTLDEITETVHEITGTVIEPANGTVQWKHLLANVAFTESFTSGQSVLLRLSNTVTYAVTWPTITWVNGSAPDLTTGGVHALVLWKEGSTLYGHYLGTV